MLIDTHCHLDFPDFATDGVAALIDRARAAGVGRMVTISTRVKKVATYRALAEAHEAVFFSVGTHPHNAAEEPEVTAADLIRLSDHPKCVAIGEAGLDYHYDKSPRPAQAASFRVHIAAARTTGLPLVIHARAADDDMIAILEEEYAKGAFPAILHCFSSGAELARRGLALGFYLSFSGILTFRNSADLRAIAAAAPLDRLLVETDAPYLAPVPHRGKRNEPGYVAHTAATLADVKSLPAAAMAGITTANALRVFHRMPPLEAA
ncbi:MAG TPA: TatD family hydrolase [Beijerinckiaceae bacterium]|nr:TatD family hydrolase [Beijerinckiaceae bacterium]